MSSKEAILGRIRSALKDVPQVSPSEDVAVDWQYGLRPEGAADDMIGLFVERVEDYKAVVETVAADDLAAGIVAVLTAAGIDSVVIPAGAAEQWHQAVADKGIAVVTDDPVLSHQQLDGTGAVVTGSRVGIAETGTIVLDHAADQGRRALSLVPDLHVCVIRADQVVSDVPEAVQRLQASIDARQPLTWISGPSATSDIELNRVEGVHGPRTLHVLLVR
jgi:L-lactate dehydrogenase complex protein LldG